MNISAPRKYTAFISYRHADNAEPGRQWATWLHHSLETYEVPPDLVGKTNLCGEPLPASLYPVFRDEVELPANADLTSQIKAALENSALLIVLCSPRAVASPFVADEIRYFKKLGRADRILAFIIDGEPNVADDLAKQQAGFRPDMECFPESLRYGVARSDGSIDWTSRSEPIAADVRPEGKAGQGFTNSVVYGQVLLAKANLSAGEAKQRARDYETRLALAKLKVIAGALGVPLGELTQRDKAYQLEKEQQRARILRRWLVVVGMLAILAVAAAACALWEQQRAVKARVQAEDLVDFLVSNLEEKLQPLVDVKLLGSINSRVETYYDISGKLEAQSDLALWNRATLYRNNGDLFRARGDNNGAITQYNQSLGILDELFKRNSGNSNCLAGLQLVYLKLGNVLQTQGLNQEAAKQFQLCQEVLQKLTRQYPEDLQYQWDQSTLYNSLGYLSRTNDLVKALQFFSDSLAIRSRLAALAPTNIQWQIELTSSHNNVGDVLLDQHKWAEALAHYQASLDLREAVADAAPQNHKLQSGLAFSYDRIGDFLSKTNNPQNDFGAALAYFQKSQVIREKLLKQDPENMNFQFGVWLSHYYQATAYLGLRRFDLAQFNAVAASNICQLALIKSPHHAQFLEASGQTAALFANLQSACEIKNKSNP